MDYWDKNLEVIKKTYPNILHLFLDGYKKLKEKYPLELIKAKDGYTITFTSDEKKKYLYSKYRPKEMNSPIKYHGKTGNDIIWLGIGLGYEFMEWYSENKVYQKVYVIEAESAMLASFLILHDVTSLLLMGKIEFVTTIGQINDIKGQIYENRRITKHWYEFYGKILLGLLPESNINKAIILRHVTFASDLVEAARELNWVILELEWQDEGSLGMAIAEFKPKFVLTINISEKIQKICGNLNLAYKSWTVDIPAYNFYLPENKRTNGWHFTTDIEANYQASIKEFKNVSYLPPATTKKKIFKTKLDQWRYLKDYVVFVGNTGYNSEFQQLSPLLSNQTKEKLNEILLEQLKLEIWSIPNLLEEFSRSYPELYNEIIIKWGIKNTVGYTVNDKVSYILGKEVTGHVRRGVIKEISKHSKVAVFGDEGWLELDNEKNFSYGGYVNHYTELPAIFRNAGVNLNLTRAYAIGKVIPVRAFDVLGANGFLLSNNDTSLFRYFRNGEHFVSDDISNIAERAREWLNKDFSFRKEIANSGQKIVIEEHTMLHRWKEIVRSSNS